MKSTQDPVRRPRPAPPLEVDWQPPPGAGARLLARFLRSVPLALALIGYLAVASALSTLIPQNQETAWYTQRYPTAVARLILTLGLQAFFRSALFLLPAVLFVVNLTLCTVHRLASRHRAGARRRYGPDLVHLGFLLLLAGGAMTMFGREEQAVYLPEGHEAALPGGGVLKTMALEFLEYPDGRPRDWLTTVEVTPAAASAPAWSLPQPRVFTIEVNRPLRMGGMKIYQTDYYQLPVMQVVQADAEAFNIIPGHELQVPGGVLRYTEFVSGTPAGAEAGGPEAGGPETGAPETGVRGTAVFEEWREGQLVAERRAAVGESLAGYRLSSVHWFPVTGLRVVRDPGFPLVVAALLLVTFGLALTFIQKARQEVTP